jgi:2-polyprenyl-3-methyl-5-hydroxy-6-metoxy-1,4-benzoquinol methylase
VELRTPRWEGDVNPAYANPRDEVTVLVPRRCHRVLDVGCSAGLMGASLRARGHEVTGVEHDPELVERARGQLDVVHDGDVEAMARDGVDLGGPFDCVVMADVLEHLRDPWSVVQWARRQLAPDGCVVISVPNIRHLETFWALAARRRWPFNDTGIFDRTHLRFFARKNLPELLAGTDLEITELTRRYLLTLDYTSRWNHLAPYLGDLGTLQFIFKAEPVTRPR